MVKTVVGEEAQLKALEETLSASASPAQVGLVVGKLSASSDRALAYSLIPTPPTDSGAPACSLLRAAPNPKAAKAASSDASSSLDFDVDWVAEHARQVSRMLLGGMTVIGIYIWASEASFKATSLLFYHRFLELFLRLLLCMALVLMRDCSFIFLTAQEGGPVVYVI
ncbi:hypothetical protein DAI22_10g044601 [Oryza sativa Japonica Group]|nr:hypothetical protein DAI22_10g044601 [Oryza sativa Japonica Group]